MRGLPQSVAYGSQRQNASAHTVGVDVVELSKIAHWQSTSLYRFVAHCKPSRKAQGNTPKVAQT